MTTKSSVELADRISRKRAFLLGAAALVFLGAQVAARPVFVDPPPDAPGIRGWLWLVNAVVLLLLLATGGGLAQRRQIRALVNDAVSERHRERSVSAGFWTAMATALAVYLIPGLHGLTAAEAVYLVITASATVAVLLFAWLEFRAHRDA
jgi:MFS family permease